MIQIGKFQSLPVSRLVSIGAFLSAGTGNDADDILLPNNQLPPNTKVGDVLEVFIYRDSEDRLIATRQKPYIQVGDLANLKVVATTDIGAFLDWGLEKDLFLPFREQKMLVREGKRYLVAAYLDKQGRICATTDVEKYLLTESPFKKDDIVHGSVFSVKPDFGAFVAIENKYIGLIPKSEYFTSLHVGDQLELRVALVREDGKITLSPRQLAYKQIENDVALLLRLLEDNNGVLPVNDDSHPGSIKRHLQLSKKAFKRALGRLLKIKRVEQIDGGIRLLPETEETKRLRREAEEQSKTKKAKSRVSYVPEALRESRPEVKRDDHPKSFRSGTKRTDSQRPRRFEPEKPVFSRARRERDDDFDQEGTPRPHRRFESDRPAFSRSKERRSDGDDKEAPRPRRFESDRPAFSRARRERDSDVEQGDAPRPHRRFESDRPAFSRPKERRFEGDESESPRPRRFESDRPVFSRAKERRFDEENGEAPRPSSQRTFSKRPFRGEDSEKEGESKTRPFFKKTAPKFGKRPDRFPRRPSSK